MRRPLTYIIVAALAVALTASCGKAADATVAKAAQEVAEPPLPQLSHNDSLRFKMLYLEAVKQQMAENYDVAVDLLHRCLAINPNAAEAYFMLSSYDTALKGDSAGFEDVKKAAELSPRNNYYLERLAQGYIKNNDYGEAIEAYKKLTQNSPKRADLLKVLVALYGKVKDYDGMISTLGRIEELEGNSEEVTLTKMQAYSLQGKKQEELGELQAMAARHPNDLNYKVMIGNWLLQNGKPQEAFSEYQNVLVQEPDNNMAMMSMIDYYNTAGQKQKADSIQEAMLLSQKTPLESKVSIIQQVVSADMKSGADSTHVLGLFKKILSQPQKTSDMAELYVAYMTFKGVPTDTISSAIEEALTAFPDNVSLRIQLLSNEWNKRDFARVAELSQQAIDYTPDKFVFYYYLGLAYVQEDEDEKALDAFRRGIAHVESDTKAELVSDVYGFIGDLLHRQDKAEETYEAYESSLKWNSDNYEVLNNYAYYLSEEGRQLAKAEQMSYRTVQAKPDDMNCLDTYAWILFKQKKYKEALPFIDMAVKNDTTASATILEHAGDIHAKNGDIDTAVSYWQKANEHTTEENAVLVRKIKLKKYIDEK